MPKTGSAPTRSRPRARRRRGPSIARRLDRAETSLTIAVRWPGAEVPHQYKRNLRDDSDYDAVISVVAVAFNLVAPNGRGYNQTMEWQDRISVNPAVRSGKPCIRGTRITVYDVLEYLAGGMTEDAILSDFPDLTRDDIRAALAFAAARERRLANSVA